MCFDEHAGDTPAMLQCVAAGLESSLNRVEQANEVSNQTLKSWLLVIAGAMVFFMQAGFAMLCAGCVRKKNVVNSMLKNLLDACGAAVAFYLVGFGLAHGNDSGSAEKSFVGDSNFVGMGDIDMGFWFFQYAFSATSVTIVAGTLAERCKMTGYFSYSVFLTGFVYPGKADMSFFCSFVECTAKHHAHTHTHTHTHTLSFSFFLSFMDSHCARYLE